MDETVPTEHLDFKPGEDLPDPCVPTELLDLHVALEKAEITPEQFKEVFGEASQES